MDEVTVSQEEAEKIAGTGEVEGQEQTESQPEQQVNLKDLSKKQLIALAAEKYNLTVSDKLKKAEVLKLVEAAQSGKVAATAAKPEKKGLGLITTQDLS